MEHALSYNSVFVHEDKDNSGRRCFYCAGVTIDTNIFDQNGLVPSWAHSLGDSTCSVTIVEEGQNGVGICGHVHVYACTYVYV